jgi:hypothetical protein
MSRDICFTPDEFEGDGFLHFASSANSTVITAGG